MRYLFIVNPIAGRGKSLVYIDKIKKYFCEEHEEVIIEITNRENHATEIAKSYCTKKDYHVFAIGGDGTINEVINGLVGTGSILSVIPCGTGNDFARSLYNNHTFDDYLTSLINGQSTYIDLAMVNNRYYVNIASIGFDSEVVENARRFKKVRFLPSSLSYMISVVYTLFKFKSTHLKIDINGKIVEKKSILLACANGQCYGGGIYIAPKAKITDGELDICHVENCSLLKIISYIPKVANRTLHEVSEVSYDKCEKITVSSDDTFVLNVDGELFRTNLAEFRIIPNGLNVMIPKELYEDYNINYEPSMSFNSTI